MHDNDYFDASVDVPRDLDAEDSLLDLFGTVRFTVRQLVIIFVACLVWVGLSSLLSAIFGFVQLFSLLVLSWLPIGSLVAAFVKINGRYFEDWFLDKMRYILSPKMYSLGRQRD